MRAVHIIKTRGIAGAERHLLDLLPGLQRRGVSTRLLVLDDDIDNPNPFADAMTAAGVYVKRMALHRRPIDPSMNARIAERLTAYEADIVHNHLIHAEFYGTLGARRVRTPRVITSRHNEDPHRRQLIVNMGARYLWSHTHAAIAISDAVRRFMIDVERVNPDKIHTIHYGLKLPPPQVDHAKARRHLRALIGADADAPVVGTASRLINAKGLPDVIDAFAQVAAQFPDARLVIAGDGPLKANLESQIKRLNLESRAHMLGWIEDAPSLIAGFDILLMPSRREGFGMTLLEAMGQAVPIIGSTAGAIPEIVAHEESGLLVPPRDPSALAAAMRLLLNDKPLRAHMGLIGQDRLEHLFNAERMIDQTLALYRTVLAGKPS